METSRPVLNRIQTPDGTILTSYHVHDYVEHVDKNGEMYMVDGGTRYLRRSKNNKPYIELSVFETDSFEKIRESLHWGTYGKSGIEPLKLIPLKDMETDHIQACLEIKTLDLMFKKFFEQELKYRDERKS